MYNPYNWNIIPRETRRELWENTMNDLAKLYAEKSIAMLGIELAIDNLQDSLQYETENHKLCSNTKHDIEHYLKKVEEYKNIEDEITHKREILNNIY